MINGQYLLIELGIILDFNKHLIKWDTDEITMKEPGALNSSVNLLEHYLMANEPST